MMLTGAGTDGFFHDSSSKVVSTKWTPSKRCAVDAAQSLEEAKKDGHDGLGWPVGGRCADAGPLGPEEGWSLLKAHRRFKNSKQPLA